MGSLDLEMAVGTAPLTLDELDLHRVALSSLIDLAFDSPGFGAITLDDLASRDAAVVWVARDATGDLVGVCTGYRVNQSDGLSLFCGVEPPKPIAEAQRLGKLGILKTVAISPLHQRQGLGVALIGLVERTLIEAGLEVIVVPAWEVAGRVNLGRAMERTGFRRVFDAGAVWVSGCDSGTFACRDRTDRCVCTAIYYAKSVS